MATFWHNVPQSVSAPAATPNFGLGAVGRVFAWIGERRAEIAVRRELSRLDDRDLHDLGISSYDFDAIAHGTFRR